MLFPPQPLWWMGAAALEQDVSQTAQESPSVLWDLVSLLKPSDGKLVKNTQELEPYASGFTIVSRCKSV